jgi:hypothetical protein
MKTKNHDRLVKQPLQIEALLAAARQNSMASKIKHFSNPPRSAARLLRKRGTPNTMGRCALTQDILQLHIRRDREEWPRTAAEAITAPPFIIGLPRTETGPAPNPEEIPPLVGRWSRQLPDP